MNTLEAFLKIRDVATNYLDASTKATDEEKANYYRHEFYRLSFAAREINLFNDWGFSNIVYVSVLDHWACVMPKDYEYLDSTSYPYSEEDPPIIFVSGNAECVLNEYLSEEKENG